MSYEYNCLFLFASEVKKKGAINLQQKRHTSTKCPENQSVRSYKTIIIFACTT
jgi:hypothetical protein